jgi:ribosomal protein S18 acetylase RimI-like enzyme
MKIKEVKRFSSGVYKALLRLLPQLDPDSELPKKRNFKTILRSENTHFFIAELDNKEIAGMLAIAVCNIPTGIKVWIEDVVVDESQRGKGIGRELMNTAINYAITLGAKSVELTSRPSRIEANKLYLKMGFALRETNVYRYHLK